MFIKTEKNDIRLALMAKVSEVETNDSQEILANMSLEYAEDLLKNEVFEVGLCLITLLILRYKSGEASMGAFFARIIKNPGIAPYLKIRILDCLYESNAECLENTLHYIVGSIQSDFDVVEKAYEYIYEKNYTWKGVFALERHIRTRGKCSLEVLACLDYKNPKVFFSFILSLLCTELSIHTSHSHLEKAFIALVEAGHQSIVYIFASFHIPKVNLTTFDLKFCKEYINGRMVSDDIDRLYDDYELNELASIVFMYVHQSDSSISALQRAAVIGLLVDDSIETTLVLEGFCNDSFPLLRESSSNKVFGEVWSTYGALVKSLSLRQNLQDYSILNVALVSGGKKPKVHFAFYTSIIENMLYLPSDKVEEILLQFINENEQCLISSCSVNIAKDILKQRQYLFELGKRFLDENSCKYLEILEKLSQRSYNSDELLLLFKGSDPALLMIGIQSLTADLCTEEILAQIWSILESETGCEKLFTIAAIPILSQLKLYSSRAILLTLSVTSIHSDVKTNTSLALQA